MEAGLPGGDGAASRGWKVRGSPGKRCGSGCARASRAHRGEAHCRMPRSTGSSEPDACVRARRSLQCETQRGTGKRGVWKNKQRLVKILIQHQEKSLKRRR